jgi:hypothetical protein
MILEKQSTVILSGWKSSSGNGLITESLQKRASGAMFPSPTIQYHGLTFTKVNMPHPSYYMNFNPTESCFRHLQILEFAQACGRLWGIWKEEAVFSIVRSISVQTVQYTVVQYTVVQYTAVYC